MNKILLNLEKLRNSKIKKLFIFIISIIIMILVYKNQELWIFRNCSSVDPSPSCKYSWQRLYLLPSFSFFLLFIAIWVDKIVHVLKFWDRFLNSLSQKKSFSFNAILVIFISIIIFYLKFSFIPLNPFNINWLLAVGGDFVPQYMGWFVFQNSPWEFPFGVVKNLNYPIGTSIGYTDSIPLLAFLFKLFIPKISDGYQYSGLWLFSCYLLQAYFSAMIVKNWNCKFNLKLISSLLIAITPPFLIRYGHLALDCHWVILASFCIYQSHSLTASKKIFLHSFLLLLSAWIHPYIAFIIFILHLGLLGSLFLEKQFKTQLLIFNFIFVSAFILLSWYLIGYFYIGGSQGTSIGFFSANLNTFFNPLTGTSQFLSPLIYWGGQYEGSAYLGAGLILLFVVVLFETWAHKSLIFTKKNISLLSALLILTLYALSNDIRFFNVTILRYPIPDFIMNILGIFQSSGRFIWPLYYFVIISILYLWVVRNRNEFKKCIFLIIILIIQFIDIYPMYKSVHFQSGQKYNSSIDISKWLNFIGTERNKILFYPAFQKFIYSDNDYADFWYLAAKHNYYLNIGYLARNHLKMEKVIQEKLLKQIQTGSLSNDSIYVTKVADSSVFDVALRRNQITCERINGFFACKGLIKNNKSTLE